jgi:tetratricopeptide (TPR) repeat protein
MNKENTYQQIQDYLEGNLEAVARAAFEAAMQDDPELKTAVDLQRLSLEAIELVIADSLREDLQAWQAADEQKDTASGGGRIRTLRRRILPLSIAATVLLVIGFFASTYLAQPYDNAALASSYYQNDLLQRVRGSRSASLLQDGMDLYESGDYEGAIASMEEVSNPALLAEAAYAIGHSHYQLADYEQAMQDFLRVIASQDPRFTEKAEFFYLLAALAADQTEQADFIQVLERIVNNESHLYHKRTVELKQKLHRFSKN